MGLMLPLVIAGAITGVVAIILGGVLGFKVLPDITEDKLKDVSVLNSKQALPIQHIR